MTDDRRSSLGCARDARPPAPAARCRRPARHARLRQGGHVQRLSRRRTATAGRTSMPIIAGHGRRRTSRRRSRTTRRASARRPRWSRTPSRCSSWAWTRSRRSSPRQKREPTPVKPDRAAVDRSAGAPRPPCAHLPRRRRARAMRAKVIPRPRRPAPRLPRATRSCCSSRTSASPGDPALIAREGACMKTIPDETFADLAAYYSSLR